MIAELIDVTLGLAMGILGVAVFLIHRRLRELINAGDAFVALTGDTRRPQCSRNGCTHGASTPCKSGLCAEHCYKFCGGGTGAYMCKS